MTHSLVIYVFFLGHGALVYDPFYHYDDDDLDALGGILVWDYGYWHVAEPMDMPSV